MKKFLSPFFLSLFFLFVFVPTIFAQSSGRCTVGISPTQATVTDQVTVQGSGTFPAGKNKIKIDVVKRGTNNKNTIIATFTADIKTGGTFTSPIGPFATAGQYNVQALVVTDTRGAGGIRCISNIIDVIDAPTPTNDPSAPTPDPNASPTPTTAPLVCKPPSTPNGEVGCQAGCELYTLGRGQACRPIPTPKIIVPGSQSKNVTPSRNVTVSPNPPSPSEIVYIKMRGLDDKKIYALSGQNDLGNKRIQCALPINSTITFPLDPLQRRKWDFKISGAKEDSNFDTSLCESAGDNIGSATIDLRSDGTSPTPIPPFCIPDSVIAGRCTKVDTAIGEVSTDPAAFVSRFFSLMLALAGAVALWLIIYSGYKIMLARGDPEKMQGARDTITSAIVGLLFIIFSFVILQLIGGILNIPNNPLK